jgi:hypothetical protein
MATTVMTRRQERQFWRSHEVPGATPDLGLKGRSAPGRGAPRTHLCGGSGTWSTRDQDRVPAAAGHQGQSCTRAGVNDVFVVPSPG